MMTDAPTKSVHFVDTVKDESLWFKDGSIVLQAENTLFKVHMSMLARESGFFAGMQDMMQPEGGQDGTEAAPLLVHDVSAKAFSHVLHMTYLPWGDPLERTSDELIQVAHAARRYQFDRLFNLVVQRLCGVLPADRRLALALAFGIAPWIVKEVAATVLAFDTVPLTATTALDAPTVAKVWKARHRVSARRLQHALDLAARHQGRTPGVGGAELCVHLHLSALKVIVDTPREHFLKALRARGETDQSHLCPRCKQATQADVEAFAGPLQEEIRVVQAIWAE